VVRCALWSDNLWCPPAFAFPINGLTFPAHAIQNRGDTTLVRCAYPCGLNQQGFLGDLADRDLAVGGEVVFDQVLPGVGLVAGLLLRLYVLVLECAIGPPGSAFVVEVDRFGKELIAIFC
jgi:hypothetical protein